MIWGTDPASLLVQKCPLVRFYPVADKINAVPLPDAIYNAYRATFKSLKLEKKVFSPQSPVTAAEQGAESENSGQSDLFEKEEE